MDEKEQERKRKNGGDAAGAEPQSPIIIGTGIGGISSASIRFVVAHRG